MVGRFISIFSLQESKEFRIKNPPTVSRLDGSDFSGMDILQVDGFGYL